MPVTPRHNEITPLGQHDSERLAKLHFDAFPPGEAWDQNQFEELLRQDSVMGYALDKGEGLRCAILVQFAADQAEILTLATAPTDRRNGLARCLMGKVEADLITRGMTVWLLDVAADNAPAIKFYQKTGFSADGRRAGYYKRLEGNRVDAILMSKPMARQGAT